jgi:hypothetical protein
MGRRASIWQRGEDGFYYTTSWGFAPQAAPVPVEPIDERLQGRLDEAAQPGGRPRRPVAAQRRRPPVPVWLVPADEERQTARETYETLALTAQG